MCHQAMSDNFTFKKRQNWFYSIASRWRQEWTEVKNASTTKLKTSSKFFLKIILTTKKQKNWLKDLNQPTKKLQACIYALFLLSTIDHFFVFCEKKFKNRKFKIKDLQSPKNYYKVIKATGSMSILSMHFELVYNWIIS